MMPTTRTESDPISLEIMWSRLINVVEECWVTIYRTAFSTIIGEAFDFGVELLDSQGNSLAHSPRSMPVFNLTLPVMVKELLKRFPAETLRPGDVLICNDPWLLAGHLYDIGIVTPVFKDGRLVGLVGSVGHVYDIGGTLDPINARELYEEGLSIPPSKLYKAHVLNEDLYEIIRANVRKPEMVLGDVHAMVAANAVGAGRLVGFMDEYGMSDLTTLATVIQDRAEEAMRRAILAVPDGVYTAETWCDGVGEPLRIPVTITVSGSDIHVDYTGAPPQVTRGAFNCTMNYTAAHTTYALKCALTPTIPSNAGCYRPITVTAPAGSLLNCRKPAAVDLRVKTGWHLAPAIFSALAQAIPDQVQAATGLPLGAGAHGYDTAGRPWGDHLFQGGGQGASARADGKNALLFPTSAGNVSVEMFETRTPLLVECKEYIPDSGGAGKQRGGLGQRVRIRRLPEANGKVLIDVHPEGMLVPAPGLFGGQAGRMAKVIVEQGGAARELPVGGLVELSGAGERVTIELAGGSGYGSPLERPRELVERDLAEGYITPEAAAAEYGYRRG